MRVRPQEEVRYSYQKLHKRENCEKPFLSSEVVFNFFRIRIVNNCGKVQHEEADKSCNCESPVHAILNSFSCDRKGNIEETILIIKIVVFFNLLCDWLFLTEKSHLFISRSASVDSFHDVCSGSS